MLRLEWRRAIGMALLVLVAVSTQAVAGKKADPKAPAKGAGAPGADAGDKPYQDWKKVTKDTEVSKGYFTLYKKRENLYLELKPEQLDKPVLGIFSFAKGIGSNFVLGGLPLGDHLLEFQRAGDHVLILEQNTRFVAGGDSAFGRARELSYGNSVEASLKIESIQDSSKAVLVDLAPFLVSDLTDLAEGLHGALGKSMRFDKDRSALGALKNFPENTEIEALLTYSPNDRQGYGLNTVPDDRYVPITVHYSFSKLPDNPMQPRLADDRTGYFLTAVKDFTRDTEDNYWRRYINHWRLEKKDPAAALSEPVKPITFYLDKTIPVRYRPYIRQGLEAWNKAFEASGFKNAVVVKDAPDDPNWDPEDVRYSTVRWIVSSEPTFGAIGPSRVDPRTGEILDADILVEGSIVQRRLQVFKRISSDPVAVEVLPTQQRWPSFIPEQYRCDAPIGIAEGSALAQIGMLVDGSLPAGQPLSEAYIGEMLRHVTLHEVGHTLGLRHNFRSSTSTPYEKLQDRAWTEQHGLESSVMDYATPNLAAGHGKQGEYYATSPGDCDLWMIRYGYTPSGAAGVDADYAFARKIADESTLPGHEYSTDEDTYPADALDPRTNIWDLGDDPLRFAQDRAAYIASLWKSPKFEERILGPDGAYPTLRNALDDLFGQYAINLGLAVKYVGGQYSNRVHRGQKLEPFVPVPAAKQREALDFLSQRAFAADAFKLQPDLLNRLAPDRWSHWGMANGFGAPVRLDYDLNDKAFAIQSALLNALTAPRLLARLREAETLGPEQFRMSELFDRLTRTLWGEVGGAPAGMKALEGPSTRRELQRAYLDRLASLVVNPLPGTPDDARALARLQLVRIDARAAQAMAGKAPLGDYARAHLLESRARIKRALEAQRSADAPRLVVPGGPAAAPSQN